MLRREEEAASAARSEEDEPAENEYSYDEGGIKNQMTERSRTVGKGYVRITLDIEATAKSASRRSAHSHAAWHTEFRSTRRALPSSR